MYKRTQSGAILKTEFEENKKIEVRERETDEKRQEGTEKRARGGGGGKADAVKANGSSSTSGPR